jgi:hypothetical protein
MAPAIRQQITELIHWVGPKTQTRAKPSPESRRPWRNAPAVAERGGVGEMEEGGGRLGGRPEGGGDGGGEGTETPHP